MASSSPHTAPAALLIGIGNEYRSDDALGLLVAREIRRRTSGAVRVMEQCGEGCSLMNAWCGSPKAVVVDAVVSHRAPGTVHRVDVRHEPVPAGLFLSTHAFGLAEAVEMCRALGTLPPSLVLLGIEGAEFVTGVGLSNAVVRSVPELVRLIERELGLEAAIPAA
jgi:hydrogenase maturation protease